MKKHLKLFAAATTLLIAAASVITFEACNKKNEVINRAPQMAHQKEIVYQNEVPDREAYILEFEKKLQSPEKSDEVLTIENANSFLFDILNYDFCNINGDGPDKACEISTYTLNLSNGMVGLCDFAVLYSQIVSHVYDYYHSLNVENKNYYCIIPKITESDSNATTATVTVKSILTSGLSNRNMTYDDTLCDYFPEGTLYPWDLAADTLTKYFNMSIHHPDMSGRIFFICLSYEFFDYLHFSQLYNCTGGCISPVLDNQEMCDLLNAYIDLAEEYKPVIKNIIESHVNAWVGDPVLENTSAPNVLNHSLYVEYGIISSTPNIGRL